MRSSRPLVAPRHPVFFLGRWLNDGTWEDINAGPGTAGLREAIRQELARPGPQGVTLQIQSFTGSTTGTLALGRGAVELPVDPDYEPPGDEPAIQF